MQIFTNTLKQSLRADSETHSHTHTDGVNVPIWASPVTSGMSAGGAGTSFLHQRYFQFITLNNSSSQPEKEQRAPSLFTLSVTLFSQRYLSSGKPYSCCL